MLKSIVNGAEHDIVSIPMKGKNLLKIADSTSKTINGVSWSINNGVVIGTGVTTSAAYQDTVLLTEVGIVRSGNYPTYFTISSSRDHHIKSGTYTFSVTAISESTDTQNKISIIVGHDGSSVNLNTAIRVFNGDTFTVSDNDTYYALVINTVTSCDHYEYKNIMLNIGSTALPYEPYGYQNGWEIRDNQNRIIWGREDELQTATGTLSFKGYALPVKVKSFLGNAVQNGTPAPDNIATPEMCGVRTGNLVDIEKKTGTQTNHYYVTCALSQSESDSFVAALNNNEGPFSASCVSSNSAFSLEVIIYYTDNTTQGLRRDTTINFTPDRTKTIQKVGLRLRSDSTDYDGTYVEMTNFMLNSGSTALPYEPYGWKVPFENNGENLFDKSSTTIYDAYFNDSGYWLLSSDSKSIKYPCLPNTQYTLSVPNDLQVFRIYESADTNIEPTASSTNLATTITRNANIKQYTFTTSSTAKVLLFQGSASMVDEWFNGLMLVTGSTAKPYSPYLNETTPIYLGEVPTIRRIKKLVLTGTENITAPHIDVGLFNIPVTDYLKIANVVTNICSHYRAEINVNGWSDVTDLTCRFYGNTGSPSKLLYIRDSSFPTVEDFKSYLATQYQNGTPVTVWYILSEPETGIVNEPLEKIGDYADELTEIYVHNLSAPLYGIGDYKDILNLSTGVVTRNIKKLVLDGTESWYKNGNTYLIRLGTIKSLSPSIGLISTHYPPEGTVANVRQYTSTYWSSTPTPVIGIRDESYTSTADFKAFLAAQYQAGTPVIVWYVLSEPTTETVTVPTGMTGEIEGYLTQVSTPSPTKRSVPKWNGKEETDGTYEVTVYDIPEIPTTTGQNKLTVNTTLAPYDVTINGHIKYTYWGKIREDVRSGLAQTKFPVGTILYDNEDETTGRAFQVVGYDKHFDPSLTARGYTHSMTLCEYKLTDLYQFDSIEAFLYTSKVIPAGTYRFTIPNYGATYGGNKTYYFTSTADLPKNSQIVMNWPYQQTPKTVTAYSPTSSITAMENTTAATGWNGLTLTEYVSGESPTAIDLGTIAGPSTQAGTSNYGEMNHIHRARYGSNNYLQSGLRQYLNSTTAANTWWKPQTIFDRPYGNRNQAGKLSKLNQNLVSVLATPSIQSRTNSYFETTSLDGTTFTVNTNYNITTDKLFLLSPMEVGFNTTDTTVGTLLDYYIAGTSTDANNKRIKYRKDNNNAYYWWLRTPYPSYCNGVRSVYTSGALHNSDAFNSLGVATACIIQ